MKLIIQIPCYNEAETLPQVMADLPVAIPGISCIETLVIDDGSDDETVAVAQASGVDHVVSHKANLGLARAFQTGIEKALQLGADIIVNTDADNQYPGRFVPALVAPILQGQADIVVGDRQTDRIPHFSATKKFFQRLGSLIVQTVSGTRVPDTVSGFRAYSREAALRVNVLTRFSYTLETIIQAGKMGLAISSVPIETNPPTRPSRLGKNMFSFIKAQASTILRVYAFYEPLRTFTYLATPFLLLGGGALLRFLYFVVTEQSGIGRYSQSVMIGTGFFLLGMFIALFGIQADIAGKHRQLTQEVLYRLRKQELERVKANIDEKQ